MSDMNLDFGQSTMIRVRLSEVDAREFQKAAAIAKRYDAISSGEIAELMVYATRYFIRDQKEAAEFFASRMAEEKRRNEPTHILKNAIEQVEEINDELDSWGEGEDNGRP